MPDNESELCTQVARGYDLNLPLPPHNLEAEQAVLGAILVENNVATTVITALAVSCFYKDSHQCIFEAMRTLFERGEPIDVLTVGAELQKRHDLDRAGGNYYLTELSGRVPSAANVEHYLRMVLDAARQRKQISILVEMLKDRCNGSSDENLWQACEELRATKAVSTNNKLKPIPLSQITEDATVSWRWYGYLADSHFTLFTGLWKAGKTTLLAHLFQKFGKGGDLAGNVEPTNVLLVTEESKQLWAKRRDELRIDDQVKILCRPFKTKPNRQQWESFIAQLCELVKAASFGLVVFDTISKLWPVRDENDSVEVSTALMPLYQIAETGCCILLVHHPRKGDANEGQASRGSGEFPAFVDIIVELRRFAPENREDRRRILTAYSRFDETPPEMVIELTDDGYQTVGTKAHARYADRVEVIAQLLSKSSTGMTVNEVWQAWPQGCGLPKPGKRTIENDLRQGVESKSWLMVGVGKKNDPHRFRAPNSIPAPNENEAARNEFCGDYSPNSIPASSLC